MNQSLELWKTCVEMANSISERRMNSNYAFITINTAILTVITYFLDLKAVLLSVVGIFICILWILILANYHALNEVKFKIILDLEKDLQKQPFKDEWDLLSKNKKHESFNSLEKWLPIVFIILFVIGILICFC